MIRAGFAITAVLLTLGSGPQRQAQVSVRVSVTGVGLHVVVRRDGRPVRDLAPLDFSLTDSGIAQEIVAVDAATVPLDVSVVVQESFRTEKFGLETFEAEVASVAETLRADDRLKVVFPRDDQRPVSQPIAAELRGAAERAGACVPVYDALARTLMQPVAPDRQHVVMVVSAGEGSGSAMTAELTADIARRSSARLYVVTIDPLIETTRWRRFVEYSVCAWDAVDWSRTRQARLRQIEGTQAYFAQRYELWLEGKQRLVAIAKLTGGGEIHPTLLTGSHTGPLMRALDDVRAGYVLRYTARGVPEAGWHPVAVTVNRPGKYDLQVRPGYLR